jgi:DNA-binding transcriptional regulator YiaG
MIFADELKGERKRLGLNQSEAATLLEVSFEAISKWERGLAAPAAIAQEGALARLRAVKGKKKW